MSCWAKGNILMGGLLLVSDASSNINKLGKVTNWVHIQRKKTVILKVHLASAHHKATSRIILLPHPPPWPSRSGLEISTRPLAQASVKTSWASTNLSLLLHLLKALAQWRVLSKLSFHPFYLNGMSIHHRLST